MGTDITDLGHGIYCLDAQYVTAGVASLYLIVEQGKVAIIETGTSHSVPGIEAALSDLGLGFDDVEWIMPTHIHLDHAGGAGLLMQRCANARLVVHPRGAPHLINPEKLRAGTIAVYGEEKFASLYGDIIPVDEQRVVIGDDDLVVDFQGRPLHILDTPGHALHHYCIHDQNSRGIFSGDNFGLSYKQLNYNNKDFIFATTTPVHFDPQAMHNSIDRLMALEPEKIYLTHFCQIEPTAEIVAQLKKSIDAFVSIGQAAADKENRVEKIEQGILQWLLSEIDQHGTHLSRERLEKMLYMDAHLNAQGVDVWMKRQQRLSA